MQNYMHETVLKDVIELVSDLKNTDAIESYMKRSKTMKSLSSSASGLVLVYPVITSNSIPIDTAQMVTKAIERKAVSMLRIVFSAMQFNNSEDVKDYLSHFHNNLSIDNDLDVDNILDTIDKYVLKEQFEDVGVDMISESKFAPMLKADFKRSNVALESDINENSVVDYTIKTVHGRTKVFTEAPDPLSNSDKIKVAGHNLNQRKFDYQKQQDAIADQRASGREFNNQMRHQETLDQKDDQFAKSHNLGVAKFNREIIDKQANIFQRNLLDNDVRKANELVETQMLIQVLHKDKNGQPTRTNAIIGIKAKMHPIDSMDVVDRLYTKNKDKNFFIKLVQASTREISFFKDFLFALDKAKIDALSNSKRKGKSSAMWKVLERRAKRSRFKRLMGSKNNAMAISTLVVSQDEVEYMKKEFNINVEKPEIIRPIMESYNLMCFVIVDESTDVAKFIFDTGKDLYEHISFNSLERESSDNQYKKIVNLIAKGGVM